METNYAQLLAQYLHTARRVAPFVDPATSHSLHEQVRILEAAAGEGEALIQPALHATTSIDTILSIMDSTGAVAGILEEHKVQVQSITGRPPWLAPLGGISHVYPAGHGDGQ